jgi:prepilin-type N-terminal cleavage/methylation domain-containing protein
MSAPLPRRTEAGFTLLELLAGILLFSILITSLFQVVRGGLEIWSMGERGRESIEKAAAVLDFVAADLRMALADSPMGATDAPVRMLCDHADYDLDDDGAVESRTQRLRFVRALPEERVDVRLRSAGEEAGALGVYHDAMPGALALAPTSGLCEVIYTTLGEPTKGRDPALLTLVRGMRAPPLAEGSFLDPELSDDPRALLARTTTLAESVLHLGFRFWGRDTVSWEGEDDGDESPLRNWDSTRALLARDETMNRFPLAVGRSSLGDNGDDVFPRRVLITLVVERDEDEALDVRLVEELAPNARRLRLSPARAIDPNARHKFVKIGGEWLRYGDVRGDELTVERGQRGTDPGSHRVGSRVRIGTTFERTVDLPVFREDWNPR